MDWSGGFKGLVVGIGEGVDGEEFVVAEGVDGLVVEESCAVDGAVFDGLEACFVFIGDGGVVDVYEAVCASG